MAKTKLPRKIPGIDARLRMAWGNPGSGPIVACSFLMTTGGS